MRNQHVRVGVRGFVAGLVLTLLGWSHGQSAEVNYDETKVPQFTLPDPLVLANGEPVTDAATWLGKRRGEILSLFEAQMFGKAPRGPETLRTQVMSVDTQALEGLATRKQIRIFFTPDRDRPCMDLLIYLPHNPPRPAPVFLGLNFGGNHTVHKDPGIAIPDSWMREGSGVAGNRATAQSRGTASSRWPVERILQRGYGLATAYYGDIDPDYDDGFQNGVHPLFYETGQTRPRADQWGSIGAWAWGLSRAMDYLEKDQDVDGRRVAVMGHSRLGKTALWAGRRTSGWHWSSRTTRAVAARLSAAAALARRSSGSTPPFHTGSLPTFSNTTIARMNCPSTSTCWSP